MTTLAAVRDFLNQNRFAMVGVSRRPKDFSRLLFREFRARGYDAVPVHPEADDIEGAKCFATLAQVQPPVDTVLLMTSPAATARLVRECAALGVRRVWMYRGGGPGAVSPEAVRFCESEGISVIPGECPFMYFPHSAWFHRVHGLVRRIAGSYPR